MDDVRLTNRRSAKPWSDDFRLPGASRDPVIRTIVLRYTIHRILLMIPTLLGVAVLVFFLVFW